ncbi:MAG: succinyl-diaminopimelate desuccinylase [Armatimonadetes bacterium]|nr:succinyl-diaminopimelate desuccinylase [Armatimonadota bacterium]
MPERDLAATTLELVAILSPTGEEERLCGYLDAWARALPCRPKLRRWRNGIVVEPPARHGGARIGLFGHVDTVAPAADQPVEIRDGRVYGCGASDMKAGLAVMMALLEQAPSLSCDVVGVFYDREEGGYEDNGLKPLLDPLPPLELGIVLEPTGNQLQMGCVGGLNATVRFRGRRAHSARPWQGDNALYRAIPFLQRLESRLPIEVRVEGLPFYEVMTPTVASTHRSKNVVPDLFEINLNYRFAPGRSLESAERELLAMVGTEAEVEFTDRSPAGEVCLDQPRIQAWLAAEKIPVEPKQAWTDVARLTARGIAAANFGPGDPAQAHQAGEWVEVAALEECRRKLERLLG